MCKGLKVHLPRVPLSLSGIQTRRGCTGAVLRGFDTGVARNSAADIDLATGCVIATVS